MLGLTFSPNRIPIPFPILTQPIPKSSQFHPHQNQKSRISPLKLGRNPRRTGVKASQNENGGGGEKVPPPPPRFNMRWLELLVDPDPDNIVAVGLTGLLAWASVQVLGQLFFISAAILVAAIKYSFIAALLIFILITLFCSSSPPPI